MQSWKRRSGTRGPCLIKRHWTGYPEATSDTSLILTDTCGSWYIRGQWLESRAFHKLQQGDFRGHAQPAEVTEETESADNIKVLMLMPIKPGPLLVEVLCGTPSEPTRFEAELHAMCMPAYCQHDRRMDTGDFRLPMGRIMADKDGRPVSLYPGKGF